MNRNMSEPRPWRLLSTRTVLEDRWLRIDAERLETDNGHIIDPWYIAHGHSWACAVALTPDRQVVMVEQYRRGVDRLVLELPAGIIDPGETPMASARRELAEESGYQATGDGIALGGWWAEPAHNTVRGHGFYFAVDSTAGALALESTEQLAVRLLSPAHIDEAIASGRFCHGLQIAFWYAACARKLV
jgi:8-oxo-dGTP pyrophosphatase MutT (NUDIX family)